jgi:hypothetical protein
MNTGLNPRAGHDATNESPHGVSNASTTKGTTRRRPSRQGSSLECYTARVT